MRTKKFASILMIALLLTQILNFSALAKTEAETEEPENIVQTAVSEWIAEYNKTAETEATKISKALQFGTEDVPGIILKYDTSPDYSVTQAREAYLAVDGNNTGIQNSDCYMPRATSGSEKTRVGRFSLNLQKKRLYNTIVIYEMNLGSSKFSDLTVTVADAYEYPENSAVADEGGFDYENPDDYTRFTTGKKSFATDKLEWTTETSDDGGRFKHTISLPEIETAQYVSLQFNYIAGSVPRIIEVEMYYEPAENIVQAAVGEWLAKYNMTAETEATAISQFLQFGTADVPGVLLKYDTSRDYSSTAEREAFHAVDGKNTGTDWGSTYRLYANSKSTATYVGRFSLNLQRQHSFNTIVIYEKETVSKFSDLTVTTADGYDFPAGADYTVTDANNAGGLGYNEIDNYERFTEGKKSFTTHELRLTTETCSDGKRLKHTIYLPETETAQFVSLQFNYIANSTPGIIEVEMYYDEEAALGIKAEGITFKVKLSGTIKGKVIAALYDDKYILQEYKMYDAAESVPVSFDKSVKDAKIKIMWWDGSDTLVPLSNHVGTGEEAN